MNSLCVGLDDDIKPFARSLFKEVTYLDKSISSHTVPIARRVVAYNEHDLNETEISKAIIDTYNDNFHKAFGELNRLNDPAMVDIEAEALVIMVNKVMENWHLYIGYEADLLSEFESISD